MGRQRWSGETSGVWELDGNWRDEARAADMPDAGDDVDFPAGNTVGCETGKLTADADVPAAPVALASLTVEDGFSGGLGTFTAQGDVVNLYVDADQIDYETDDGVAYLRAKGCAVMNVARAASSPGDGRCGVNLSTDSGGDRLTALNLMHPRGSVGIADLSGETAEIPTINISGNGEVVLGAGLTATTLNVSGGGTLTIRCNVTTLNVTGGNPTIHVEGSAAIGSLNGDSGQIYYNSTGTLGGTPRLGQGAMLDFSGTHHAKTVTNPVEMSAGSSLKDPNETVANLRWDLNDCGVEDVTLQVGRNVRLTRSSLSASSVVWMTVPLTMLRCVNAGKDALPDTAEGAGGSLGLADAIGSLVLGSTTNNTSLTEYASYDLVLPKWFADHQDLTIRLTARVSVARAASSLVDLVAKRIDEAGLDATDLCITGAQEIKDTTTLTAFDFTIDGDSSGDELTAGSVVHLEMALDICDIGGGSDGYGEIALIQLGIPHK